MTYCRVDVGFPGHEKALRAGGEAIWLWLAMKAFAKLQGTDGRIPGVKIGRLDGPKPSKQKRLTVRLLEAGLLEQVGNDYQLHDYLDWEESAEQAEMRKESGRRRKREFDARNRVTSAPRNAVTNTVTVRGGNGVNTKPSKANTNKQTPHTPQGGAVSTQGEKTSAATTATERNGVVLSAVVPEAQPALDPAGLVDLPLAERSRRYLADPMGERFTLGDAAGWPEVQAVMAVWESEWRPTTLRGGLTDPRLRAILARLSEGYTPEQLGEAIKGSRLDDWLKQNRKLQTPATVLASSDAVDKYAGLLDTKPVVELTGLARAHHEALEGKRGELAQQIARKHTDPHEWHYEFEEAKREVGT